MTRWQIAWFLLKLIFRRAAAELPQELAPKIESEPQQPIVTSPLRFDPIHRRMVRR